VEQSKAQVEQHQPTSTSNELFISGELQDFQEEILQTNAREKMLKRRHQLPIPQRNANACAEKYDTLKKLSKDIEFEKKEKPRSRHYIKL
jgi:hypothetical protein